MGVLPDFPPRSFSTASRNARGRRCVGVVYAEQAKQYNGMNRINEKLFHSRKDARHRQRIVEVGGAGPMTQDRVKCPFCSELIMRDAIKCR